MRTQAFVAEMAVRLNGIGGTESGAVRTPRINVPDLFNIEVLVPDLLTRGLTAAESGELEAEASKAAALIARADHLIALAKERRSALIAVAVTGDVSPHA
jgi:type I restriction enzyme S subunit